MSNWTAPWLSAEVAAEQARLVESQMRGDRPIHFKALQAAARVTSASGASILEVGSGPGHGAQLWMEALPALRYHGVEPSPAARAFADARHDGGEWFACLADLPHTTYDVVIDGCAALHVEDWRAHLRDLAARSTRWVILHRAPLGSCTTRDDTSGYGRTFPAWRFGADDLASAMSDLGFNLHGALTADGHSQTLVFVKPRHYITIHDDAYATRADVMVESLAPYVSQVHRVWWNDADDRATLAKWPDRTRVERIWSELPRRMASLQATLGQPVTYVDADVMFWRDPEEWHIEAQRAGVGFVRHGFAEAAPYPIPTTHTHESAFGVHNVGVIYSSGRKFPSWWAGRCAAWCYDRVEAGMYGDQKYLDHYSDRFPSVSLPPRACLGPWGLHAGKLSMTSDGPTFNDAPVTAFHYSSLRVINDVVLPTRPEYQLTPMHIEMLYTPYIEKLRRK